jgi:hypothetical protein
VKLSDIPVVTVSDKEWEQYQPVTIKEPKPMTWKPEYKLIKRPAPRPAPLTPEEKARRLAVLAALYADPAARKRFQDRQADRFLSDPRETDWASIKVGKVEWPAASVPEPPAAPGPVHRQLPVEKHMLDEREWVSQHHLGEKA